MSKKKTVTACEFLRESGEQSLSGISELLGVPRERARLMLRKLEKNGCVERRKQETVYVFRRMPRQKKQSLPQANAGPFFCADVRV